MRQSRDYSYQQQRADFRSVPSKTTYSSGLPFKVLDQSSRDTRKQKTPFDVRFDGLHSNKILPSQYRKEVSALDQRKSRKQSIDDDASQMIAMLSQASIKSRAHDAQMLSQRSQISEKENSQPTMLKKLKDKGAEFLSQIGGLFFCGSQVSQGRARVPPLEEHHDDKEMSLNFEKEDTYGSGKVSNLDEIARVVKLNFMTEDRAPNPNLRQGESRLKNSTSLKDVSRASILKSAAVTPAPQGVAQPARQQTTQQGKLPQAQTARQVNFPSTGLNDSTTSQPASGGRPDYGKKSMWSRFNNKMNKQSLNKSQDQSIDRSLRQPSLINCIKIVVERTNKQVLTGDNAQLLYGTLQLAQNKDPFSRFSRVYLRKPVARKGFKKVDLQNSTMMKRKRENMEEVDDKPRVFQPMKSQPPKLPRGSKVPKLTDSNTYIMPGSSAQNKEIGFSIGDSNSYQSSNRSQREAVLRSIPLEKLQKMKQEAQSFTATGIEQLAAEQAGSIQESVVQEELKRERKRHLGVQKYSMLHKAATGQLTDVEKANRELKAHIRELEGRMLQMHQDVLKVYSKDNIQAIIADALKEHINSQQTIQMLSQPSQSQQSQIQLCSQTTNQNMLSQRSETFSEPEVKKSDFDKLVEQMNKMYSLFKTQLDGNPSGLNPKVQEAKTDTISIPDNSKKGLQFPLAAPLISPDVLKAPPISANSAQPLFKINIPSGPSNNKNEEIKEESKQVFKITPTPIVTPKFGLPTPAPASEARKSKELQEKSASESNPVQEGSLSKQSSFLSENLSSEPQSTTNSKDQPISKESKQKSIEEVKQPLTEPEEKKANDVKPVIPTFVLKPVTTPPSASANDATISATAVPDQPPVQKVNPFLVNATPSSNPFLKPLGTNTSSANPFLKQTTGSPSATVTLPQSTAPNPFLIKNTPSPTTTGPTLPPATINPFKITPIPLSTPNVVTQPAASTSSGGMEVEVISPQSNQITPPAGVAQFKMVMPGQTSTTAPNPFKMATNSFTNTFQQPSNPQSMPPPGGNPFVKPAFAFQTPPPAQGGNTFNQPQQFNNPFQQQNSGNSNSYGQTPTSQPGGFGFRNPFQANSSGTQQPNQFQSSQFNVAPPSGQPPSWNSNQAMSNGGGYQGPPPQQNSFQNNQFNSGAPPSTNPFLRNPSGPPSNSSFNVGYGAQNSGNSNGGFALGNNNKKPPQAPANDGDDLFATNRPMYRAKRNF